MVEYYTYVYYISLQILFFWTRIHIFYVEKFNINDITIVASAIWVECVFSLFLHIATEKNVNLLGRFSYKKVSEKFFFDIKKIFLSWMIHKKSLIFENSQRSFHIMCRNTFKKITHYIVFNVLIEPYKFFANSKWSILTTLKSHY